MRDFLVRRWHRLRTKALAEAPPLRPISLLEAEPLVEAVKATRGRLERILFENIVPFWLRCIDEDCGGYLFNHDERGVWKGPADKHVIPHARTCWFFSRLAARGDAPPAALSAARHGYRFLRDRLWDSQHGGFFWILDSAGERPVDDDKRLIAQTFGLYAVSEFAAASRDETALAMTTEVLDVLERRFHDPRHGGYRSQTTRAWQVPGDKPASWVHKTVNDHLHVLEALSRVVVGTRDSLATKRLVELIVILTGSVVRKTMGAVTDRHRADWTPLVDARNAFVSYGHDLESVWLVLEACAVVGLPQALVIDWARTLADYTCTWGVDRRRGGIYLAGPVGGPAHSREKVWWVQAEVLVGFLCLYRVTGEQRYAEAYLRILDWIEQHHVDWTHGDWHAVVGRSRISSDKAGVWKSPYHNGRAMMMCLELVNPAPSESSES